MLTSEKMRAATDRAHQQLHETEVARRLEDGSIERQTYVDYLIAVAVLVASLRTAIRRLASADLKSLLPTFDDWSERIETDIRTLAADDATANERAQTIVVNFVQKAYAHFGDDSKWLYGVLYVLYGSHNGNRMMAKAVSRGLDLNEDSGTSYFRATQSKTSAWREFKAFMDERVTTEEQRRSAEAGAAENLRVLSQDVCCA